jgi:hypothetical protein
MVAATVAALTVGALPGAAGAQEPIDPNAEATFLGSIDARPASAKLRVRYTCAAGEGLWVSAKQSRSGRRDRRLTREGSSEVAASWLQSHRNRFVCDGTSHTATFTIDKVERGSKGRLRRGRAWVQFCVTTEQGLVLSKAGWVRVR